MLDQLRAQMAAFLAAHEVCILSTSGVRGAWAMPARYRPALGACGSRGLEVDCLIPRWADVAYFVERDPNVLLLIGDAKAPATRWLQIEGTVYAMADPDWAQWLPVWSSPAPPAELYLLLRVTPRRVELFDAARGWGAREGVEL